MTDRPAARPGPWHTLSAARAMASLGTDPARGLSAREADERLARYGRNRLAEPRPRPLWLHLLDQFRNVLVAVLLGGAALAWAIGRLADAVVILVVVTLNAVLGLWQEYRAERTLAALKRMLTPQARVRRDGEHIELESARLVPGDIVQLEAGDRVPADGRLIVAHRLEVDESALTGESETVVKDAAALPDTGLPLTERTNLLYMHTVVARGRAELLITATGMDTEIGRLAGLIAGVTESATPLQRQLDALGARLAVTAGAVVLVVFALDLGRGLPWADAALTAVALAVAAIPEGLPAVVTVTLAVGMWRMAKHRAIVKRLVAVETLGSTTVVCADKTGTLTLNEMTARAGWLAGGRFTVSGEGYQSEGEIRPAADRNRLRPLLRCVALCNDSRVGDGHLMGDPTEGALWVLAQKGGIDPGAEQARRPRIAEIPFDAAHRFMATFHHAGEVVLIAVKGAPAVLLERCSRWLAPGGPAPLGEMDRRRIESEVDHLAGQALRVIAVASRRVSARTFDPAGELWPWADGWTFLGLVGLMDPPRAGAGAAIERCRRAGIQVKMITGDHRATAAAVGRALGLAGEVLAGSELGSMTEEELSRRVARAEVFARVLPEHKVRIVQALRSAGHVVAMTGDGVNDAAALKAAHIGVAMGGRGTEVARQAAAVVLTDDDFATIVRAVEEGRVIYDNIVKFVQFQLSTNIGAILTVLTATLLGMPTPFTAIQILWINIIMDGPPAMTLGLDPARPGIMEEPPRPRGRHILDLARLGRLATYGLTMMAGTLWVFQQGLTHRGPAYALTLAFTTFVLFQLFNVFNARAGHRSAFNVTFFRNGKLWLALGLVLLLQALVVHWGPAQAIFSTRDLAPGDWALAALIASSVLLLDETRKLSQRRWRARR